MHQNGNGIPQDHTETAKWFRLIAEQEFGNPYNFGPMLDYPEVMRWYYLAEEQDRTDAQYNLGLMYYNGDGVAQDYTEAAKWYYRAAERGLADAQYNLGRMYYNGDGVVQDYTEAAKWFHRAAEQGDARKGYFHCTIIYLDGEGELHGYSEPVGVRLEDIQGHARAQFYLGLMYKTGTGVPQDDKEAVKWFRSAALQGDAGGKLGLRLMHDSAKNAPQDNPEEIQWVRLAAEQGDAMAQLGLGFMYGYGDRAPQGYHVPRDYIEAYKWFSLVAPQSSGKRHEVAITARDDIAKEMTPVQIAKSQRLARE